MHRRIRWLFNKELEIIYDDSAKMSFDVQENHLIGGNKEN